MQDRISVIIPCRNGTNYLAEAVAGIRKQEMPLEIIVVDDASTDATAALAESLHCRVIRHEATQGFVAGKNTGLKAAQGEFILFHDHDDVMNSGVLSTMYQELISDKDMYLVMAKARDFISPELDEEAMRQVQIKQEPYYGLYSGAILMRRNLFDCIGYFDEQLRAGDMIVLMTKIHEKGVKYKKLDLVATNRRVHRTNYGRTHADVQYKDYAKNLRARLR